MIYKVQTFFKNESLINVFSLMSGTVVAQLISIGMMPILSRLYAPTEFGVLATMMSIVSLLGVVATLRYEYAISQAIEDREASILFFISISSSIFFTILLYFLVSLFPYLFLKFFGENLIGKLYFIPFFCITVGVHQSSYYWLIRKKKFKVLSVNRVNQSVPATIFQYLFFHLVKSNGLIWGSIVGQTVATIHVFLYSIRDVWKCIKPIGFRDVIFHLKKHKEFPMVSIWGAFFNSVSAQMPVLILGKFFLSESVGYFSLTYRVLAAPIGLITFSLSQVLYQKFIEVNQNSPDKLRKLVIKVLFMLLIFILPFSLIIFFFGEKIFVIFFGNEWRKAGEFAAILIPAISAKFIVTPIGSILSLARNLKLGFVWHSIYLISICTTLYLAKNLEIQMFLKIFTIHEVLLMMIFCKIVLVGCSETSK